MLKAIKDTLDLNQRLRLAKLNDDDYDKITEWVSVVYACFEDQMTLISTFSFDTREKRRAFKRDLKAAKGTYKIIDKQLNKDGDYIL